MHFSVEQLCRILGGAMLTQMIGRSDIFSKNGAHVDGIFKKRLEVIDKMVWYLKGAYTDEGIALWFLRKHAELGEKSAFSLLNRAWNPSGLETRSVIELARAQSTSSERL